MEKTTENIIELYCDIFTCVTEFLEKHDPYNEDIDDYYLHIRYDDAQQFGLPLKIAIVKRKAGPTSYKLSKMYEDFIDVETAKVEAVPSSRAIARAIDYWFYSEKASALLNEESDE